MSIDWFTVIAQLVNFLILVWLLQRFLYRPILKAVDEREKKIAAQLAEAADRDKAAQEQLTEYHSRNDALRQQSAELLENARTEAGRERDHLIEEARKNVDAQRADWQKALDTEQQQYANDLQRRIQETVLTITRQVLSGLAGSELEENMTTTFLERLSSLESQDRDKLVQAIAASDRILIRSSFPLPQEVQTALHDALSKLFPALPDLAYEQDQSLICGISLYVPGYTLQWNVNDYLQQLQQALWRSSSPTP